MRFILDDLKCFKFVATRQIRSASRFVGERSIYRPIVSGPPREHARALLHAGICY